MSIAHINQLLWFLSTETNYQRPAITWSTSPASGQQGLRDLRRGLWIRGRHSSGGVRVQGGIFLVLNMSCMGFAKN